MCKKDSIPAQSGCSAAGTSACKGSCAVAKLATPVELEAAVVQLRSAPGLDALSSLPAEVRQAVELLVTNTKLSLFVQASAAPVASQVPILVRRMKTPEGSRAYSGEELATRMMEICGCKGKYDCDCVSVKNMASMELWYRHNAGVEDPDRFARRQGKSV
jgi:hypothetical protein